jgi:hypothetical protein
MPQSLNDNDIVTHTMEDVLSQLDRVRPTTRGWSARCPAHPDRTPSLSVAEGDIGVLVKCWAGCTVDEIADAMGLRVANLFYGPLSGQRPRKRTARSATKRIDWRKQAGALQDAAITLWLHANEVFAFACNLDTAAWTDEDWDSATEAVCDAYKTMERAEALEAEAFRLRETNLQKEKAIGCTSRTVKRTR